MANKLASRAIRPCALPIAGGLRMAVSIAIMVDAFREGLNKCTFRARLAIQFLIQHAVALLNGIADGLVGSDTSPERRGARTCGMPAGWGRKRCCSVRPAPRRDPGSRSEVAASRILLPDLLLRRHRRSDRSERRRLATFTRTAPRDLRTGRLATGLLVAPYVLQAGKLIDAVRRWRAVLKQMTLRVVSFGQALDARASTGMLAQHVLAATKATANASHPFL